MIGQDKLNDNIISDALIKKFKIKQITEDWFTDSLKALPTNTNIEKYNEIGQKTQEVNINYTYHKFINDYKYKLKKGLIIKVQHYYDWNPYRTKRKGDTIVKKTVSKYSISSKMKLKIKASRFENFQVKETFDNYGRITEKIDTVKCGYNITNYTYNRNNKLVERKYYSTHHSESPSLYAVDSLHYNLDGQLIKEASYYDIKMTEDKWVCDREVIRIYSYNQYGLIMKKNTWKIYNSLNKKELKPTIYRYEYDFY
ncbi:hypothetical protein [Bernardetia sp. MNP-M8]|uniref:hypothetical protein n=1 Tax=Bernardetia sp. MNP-M8 TaxID=3127470 RepID=UPI0030D10D8F